MRYFNKLNIGIHSLCLQFLDEKLEEEFSIQHNKDSLIMGQLAIVLTFFLFILYGFGDAYAYPSNYKELWLIRVLADILLVILFLATLLKNSVNHLQRITSILVLIAGLTQIYSFSYKIETDLAYIYLASYVLLIAGAFTLSGLKFLNALKVVLFLDIILLILFYVKLDLVSNLFFVMLFVSITCIVVINSYFSETLKRKLFLKDLGTQSLLDDLIIAKNRLDEQNSELKENQILMIEQARFASAGELIGNVAHQWRQPLNALSIVIQKLDFFQKRDLLDEEAVKLTVSRSVKIINNMSRTIDEFRDFFNPKKEKKDFLLADAINSAYSIVEASLVNKEIQYTLSLAKEGIHLNGYANEFSQVIISLLTNSKDALMDTEPESKFISIEIDADDEKATVRVCDNGGGVREEHIDRIFEPYFTTKEEGKGTGVGLYMSRTIIENHMGGRIYAENLDNGVCFTIELNTFSVSSAT